MSSVISEKLNEAEEIAKKKEDVEGPAAKSKKAIVIVRTILPHTVNSVFESKNFEDAELSSETFDEKEERIVVSGNRTIVIIEDSYGDKFKGIARCDEEDEFDFVVGYKLAHARASIKRARSAERKIISGINQKSREKEILLNQIKGGIVAGTCSCDHCRK